MSLKYRNNSGVETPIAGLNGTSGELVPSVSYYQTGTVTLPASGETSSSATVTLPTAMPDTDYVVVLDQGNTYLSSVVVRSKTTTGFEITGWQSSNISVTVTVKWQAFKLMTDESRALDEAQIEQNASDIAALQSKLSQSLTLTNKTTTPSGNIDIGLDRTNTVLAVMPADGSTQYICTPWYDPNGRAWYAHITNGDGSELSSTVTISSLLVRYI